MAGMVAGMVAGTVAGTVVGMVAGTVAGSTGCHRGNADMDGEHNSNVGEQRCHSSRQVHSIEGSTTCLKVLSASLFLCQFALNPAAQNPKPGKMPLGSIKPY